MEKAGIITFHRATSYGATLQTYAIYTYLYNNGYDVEVIDYTNPVEQESWKWAYKEGGHYLGYLTSAIKNIFFFKRKNNKKAFGSPDKYYKLTKQRYKRKRDLDKLEYDILVAGSDQIWNPQITKGIDDAFLLNFGYAKKRISIASSIGSSVLTKAQNEVFKEAFKRFDHISVRESFAKSQLQNNTKQAIHILPDPTFLLTYKEWDEQLIEKSKYYFCEEVYILTFFVAPCVHYREKVQDYANKLNLPVWSIQSTRLKRMNSDRIITGASLEDFLALIKNAKLVITDSFHGVVMSLQMKSDFVPFSNNGNPIRVENLLNDLDISERIDMTWGNYYPVNYNVLNPKLQKKHEIAQNWVKNAMVN